MYTWSVVCVLRNKGREPCKVDDDVWTTTTPVLSFSHLSSPALISRRHQLRKVLPTSGKQHGAELACRMRVHRCSPTWCTELFVLASEEMAPLVFCTEILDHKHTIAVVSDSFLAFFFPPFFPPPPRFRSLGFCGCAAPTIMAGKNARTLTQPSKQQRQKQHQLRASPPRPRPPKWIAACMCPEH